MASFKKPTPYGVYNVLDGASEKSLISIKVILPEIYRIRRIEVYMHKIMMLEGSERAHQHVLLFLMSLRVKKTNNRSLCSS